MPIARDQLQQPIDFRARNGIPVPRDPAARAKGLAAGAAWVL